MNDFRPYSALGFTLIEIAIVIAVIAILFTAILKGESLLQQSKVQSTIAIVDDLSTALLAFKQRYHYLPGDFPIDATSPEISGVPAACIIGGANAGNGNGVIGPTESVCVLEHLAAAAFIKRGAGVLQSAYGPVQVIANASSQTALGTNPLPSNMQNVIEFANLPCAVAQEIDRKIDDSNIATGRARASVASCLPDAASSPVPFYAVGL